MNETHTVLLFGAAGQLGADCALVIGHHCRLVQLDLPEVDVSDAVQCHAVLDRYRPDIVINCAAFTDVDGAEIHAAQAWRVNAEAPAFMADWVEIHGSWLIHISTDFVFDGSKPPGHAYVETDMPGPLSVYGKTKLAGEKAVIERTKRHSILRTAWLYGRSGKNFLKTILRLSMSRPDIKVVDDQFGTPTWSFRLAEQIERIMALRLPGIIHASAEGQCSWHDFALTLMDAMNIACRLSPCSSDAYPTAARRPRNSTLENQRLKELGHNLMVDWRTDLLTFTAQFRDQLLKEVSS